MTEEETPKSLEEFAKVLTRDFALNTYVTATLEGKTLLDLDMDELWQQLNREWQNVMTELPKMVDCLTEGRSVAARYSFGGQERLVLGVSPIGPYMRIEPSILIGYAQAVFDNPAAISETLKMHQSFDEITSVLLGYQFGNLEKREESRVSAEEFILAMAKSRPDSLAYRVKRGVAFGVADFFSRRMKGVSYAQFIKDKALETREEIRTYDALARFFQGERNFADHYTENHPTVDGRLDQIHEIRECANKMAHNYSRLRDERLKDLQTDLMLAPARF